MPTRRRRQPAAIPGNRQAFFHFNHYSQGNAINVSWATYILGKEKDHRFDEWRLAGLIRFNEFEPQESKLDPLLRAASPPIGVEFLAVRRGVPPHVSLDRVPILTEIIACFC